MHMAMIGVLLIGITFILIKIYLGLRVISFFFAARGLQVMAKNRNQKNAWLAYVPVIQNYTLGKVVGTFRIFKSKMNRAGLYLTILLALAGICRIPYFDSSVLTAFGNLFILLYLVLKLIVYYNLFARYLNHIGKAILFTVLSVVFAYFSLASYFIFAIKKKPYTSKENEMAAET
jgi:hypothetical protein